MIEGTDWRNLLQEVQNEIAALDPNPYYVRAYRAAESFYWQRIPAWICEDWAGRGLRACLDIGCAYGTLALFCRKLAGCALFCTDFIPAYLSASLLRRHEITFAVNNIERDPFPWPMEYDAILFTEVLEHLNFHPLPTLRRIHDLLSPAGRLYLSTPDAAEWGRVTKYYSGLEEIPYPAAGRPVVDDHVYVYTENELLGLLKEADLHICRFDYSPGVCGRHFNLTLTRR